MVNSGGAECRLSIEKRIPAMDKPSYAMQAALRIVKLYGYLIARTDRLYHPGSNDAVCSLYTAQEMVRSGWLIVRNGRYEITPEGRRFGEPD
jgi:hypothetical protein